MIDYKKIKEENAADMFIESGRDLAGLDPRRFIEECKKIPLLSAIMDKALPCKKEVEMLRRDKGMGFNGVSNKRKVVRYATPTELDERYELGYDSKDNFSLNRKYLKSNPPVSTRPCEYSGSIKVTINAPIGNAKTMFLSDVVFCLHHGRWPTLMHQDGKKNNGSGVIHVDGNITNNYPSNLRENLGKQAHQTSTDLIMVDEEFRKGTQQRFLPRYMNR